MLKKTLSLFIAFAVLFSGCSNKTVYPKQDVRIYTFLTDKDESFYMFVSDKYSYIFEDKETISELKELIKLARSSGEWKLGNKPKIYLEKDLVVKIYMTFLVKGELNQLNNLRNMGFEVSKGNSSFYFKDIQLIGKYGKTDIEIKEKFQQNYLSHSIVFEEINLAKIEKKEIPRALEIIGTIVLAPVAVVGLFIVFPAAMIFGCIFGDGKFTNCGK